MVGVDTAAHLPAMTIYELAKKPDLRSELEALMKEDIQNIHQFDPRNINNNDHLLSMITKETLRFYFIFYILFRVYLCLKNSTLYHFY
jgi:cytochrome P450